MMNKTSGCLFICVGVVILQESLICGQTRVNSSNTLKCRCYHCLTAVLDGFGGSWELTERVCASPPGVVPSLSWY